jgi:hypothetical protein
MTTTPTVSSPRVAALLEKMRGRARGRLIFAIDATQSRERTWDLACQLQGGMFEEAAKIGGLEIQLVFYRGANEVRSSAWLAEGGELARRMRSIRCDAGLTKIARVLKHVRREHERAKVDAAVFVGDACEEIPGELYDAAGGLDVPVFLFQEGDGLAVYVNDRGGFVDPHPPQKVEDIFREIARLTNGAYAKFDAGAAAQLGELLRAIAAFACGGLSALSDLRTDAARKLIAQLK